MNEFENLERFSVCFDWWNLEVCKDWFVWGETCRPIYKESEYHVLAARTVGQYIYASRAQYTSTCTKAVAVRGWLSCTNCQACLGQREISYSEGRLSQCQGYCQSVNNNNKVMVMNTIIYYL
jgi:hypothetical protein